MRKPPSNVIPEVRKVNFEGFINRFSEDEDVYALDVLIATDDLKKEIRHERNHRRAYQRQAKEEEGTARGKPELAGDISSSSGSYESIPIASTQPEEGGWVQRVRIQSKTILYYLSEISGESWVLSLPCVFHRPFTIFISSQDKLKDVLAGLELRWAQSDPEEAVDCEKALNDGATDASESDPDEQEFEDDKAIGIRALREIQCYVNFVDEEILPLVSQFGNTDHKKVRFQDLWFLFKLGDLVCVSDVEETPHPDLNLATRDKGLWRVSTLCNTVTDASSPTPPKPRRRPKSEPSAFAGFMFAKPKRNYFGEIDRDFSVKAYYIDYDGSSYGAIQHWFQISPYLGARDITTLPCYPIRYLEGWKTQLERQKTQGRRFESCLMNKHQSYSGWAIISPPGSIASAKELSDNGREVKSRHTEYIDGPVVIDFAEAFHNDPEQQPFFLSRRIMKSGSEKNTGALKLWIWSDPKRSKLCAKTAETIHPDEKVARRQLSGEDHDDGFSYPHHRRLLKSDDARMPLEDRHYALLPRRMFAYALKERKFAIVDVRYLRNILQQPDVFNSLKIHGEYKQMVRSLVASHLRKKELEELYPREIDSHQSQDVIYGKGRGLVILLHGVPGVGKTATAEAVALEYGKPLFAITCGDLGLTPKEVEESLTEIFRLAHLWQCVLLFDEADVFLAQRSRYDLTRNALVSVFLRILEYYNGILFLTTNRVGTLDEAFKSRVHMSLYYPPLNSKQVELIFSMNLKRLAEIEKERHQVTGEPELDIHEPVIMKFADEHSEKTRVQGGRWNGRQIRNAFQIAASLARYHANEEDKHKEAEIKEVQHRRPVLDATQFRKVERATEAFKNYLETTKGYSDADLAHILGDRDDLYRQGKLFDVSAGPSTAGYHSTGPHSHGTQYPSGSYGHGMHPEHAGRTGASGAPNVDFPMMNPGPMAYGYNESSRQPEVSHGGIGVGGYPTAPQQHPGLNRGNFQTPMANPGQSGEPYRGRISGGPQQGYGPSMNPNHGYLRGGHPSMYESGGHPPPQQPRRSPAPDESRYD
ncbi:ATPase AAA-type core [Fusarium albosuccineum]|uniref:ATPase AAA-type core n=1 Tax=Fusarium albosuccineum TaxID=1237068 RepID=A0A8H4L3I3_9HYPO|nr:ATPase AAA-type core [Fusarium albosuccineum]